MKNHSHPREILGILFADLKSKAEQVGKLAGTLEDELHLEPALDFTTKSGKATIYAQSDTYRSGEGEHVNFLEGIKLLGEFCEDHNEPASVVLKTWRDDCAEAVRLLEGMIKEHETPD